MNLAIMNYKLPLILDTFIPPNQTTHVGGKGEHLHDWYPYIEGFSSGFVNEVQQTYLPNAKLILEPFAGVGTTPINLNFLDINCIYSEVNPVMQKIIALKSTIIKKNLLEKIETSEKIFGLIKNLENNISNIKPDENLKHTYSQAFKNSKFFNDENFINILKTRSLIDFYEKTDKELANIIEVATLACLIRSSLLKRHGDLRFKTPKELEKGTPIFIDELKSQLTIMAKDILTCPTTISYNKLILSNSKNLINNDIPKIDGVITSPPYLNGTNYFRNTKLELWFSKYIKDSKSLRFFRNEAIVSGINDVTKDSDSVIPDIVKDIYIELKKNSYDDRIPKMVAGYTHEMSLVFKGITKNLKNGGIVCIDIGDSIYANIHVPTDEIITSLAKQNNLLLVDKKTLRKRKSKNNATLTQSLLVFAKNRV